MVLKIKDKDIVDDLLKAYRAGEQKGLTIAKETPRDTGNPYNDMTGVGKGKALPKGTPPPKDLQLQLFDTRPYNTSSLFIKNVGDKGAKITDKTILLPTKPKGKSTDITSPYYADNYYGLQAHGPGQEDIRDKFSYRTDGVLMIDPKRDGTLRPATRDEEVQYQLQRLQYEENPYAPFPHEHGDDYGLKISPKLAQGPSSEQIRGALRPWTTGSNPWTKEGGSWKYNNMPTFLQKQILKDASA